MNQNELRKQFEIETAVSWENSQGEPDIDYVIWLENKLSVLNQSLPTETEKESATDKFKQYLNSVMDKVKPDIHNELWNHLTDCIIEKEKMKLKSHPSQTEGEGIHHRQRYLGYLKELANTTNNDIPDRFIHAAALAYKLLSVPQSKKRERV